MINHMLAALSFLSRLPLGKLLPVSTDLGKATAHFPLAGFAAAGVFLGSFRLFGLVFKDELLPLLAAFTLTYYLFNLFHFDGFLDSVDGLLSQKSRERILEIMKQGNSGPSALFFGTVYVLTKVYLLTRLDPLLGMLPVFVIARWGMGFTCAIARPARTDGLAAAFLGAPFSSFLFSCFYLLLLFPLFPAMHLGIPIAAVLIIDYLITKLVSKKIGGLTGDNLGFINEVNELLILLLLTAAIDK